MALKLVEGGECIFEEGFHLIVGNPFPELLEIPVFQLKGDNFNRKQLLITFGYGSGSHVKSFHSKEAIMN